MDGVNTIRGPAGAECMEEGRGGLLIRYNITPERMNTNDTVPAMPAQTFMRTRGAGAGEIDGAGDTTGDTLVRLAEQIKQV